MRDDGLVKVFGFDHPDLKRIAVYEGTKCFYCEEPILASESGFSMISIGEFASLRVYEHRACFLRGIFGSVAHIEKQCSCFVPGSTCTDPEGMTLREAAEAAVASYEAANRWRTK